MIPLPRKFFLTRHTLALARSPLYCADNFLVSVQTFAALAAFPRPSLRFVLSSIWIRPTQRVGVASQTKFAKIGRKQYDSTIVDYQSIITIEPGKREGRPCIWSTRIAVTDALGWLAVGMVP